MRGFSGESAVERRDGQLRGRGECLQVRVGPVFWRWTTMPGQRTKDALQSWGLFQKTYAVILEPGVVSLPRVRLIHDVRLHYSFRREQTKQTKLGETAEEKA